MGAFDCCRNCTTNRHIGCHADCKEYKNAKEAWNKRQAEIREKDRIMKEYTRERIIRTAKQDASKTHKKKKTIYN